MPPVKVATCQFTVTYDVDQNLATLLAKLDEAAANGARLIVFMEFCNHPTWYPNQDAAYEAAIAVPGPFIQAVQDRAKARGCYVVFNATIKGPQPTVYDQSHLVSPKGELIGTVQKQVLMPTEKLFYTPGPSESRVYETAVGRIGMYACMDGVVPETPRVAALQGAQILINSLSSNALDESQLHIPVRACENGCWVISANRCGPLIDEADMPALVARNGVPRALLIGGGESQVVSPTGEILARARLRTDDMVYATIVPELADDKRVAGGGDRFADRRPDCYGVLAVPNSETPHARRLDSRPPAATALLVAAVQVAAREAPDLAIADALRMATEAAANGARLIVLPELFPFLPGTIARDPAEAARVSASALNQLRSLASRSKAYVIASLVEAEGARCYHTTYAVDDAGAVCATYRQVHVATPDRAWASAGDRFVTFDTPFGIVGLLAGYDGLFPESTRVLAKMGADLICYPTSWLEDWQASIGIAERGAENHVQIVAANRPDSRAKGGSVIIRLPAEYAFPISSVLNMPLRDAAPAGIEAVVYACVDVTLSRDKKLMRVTDLIMDSRPDLYGRLIAL